MPHKYRLAAVVLTVAASITAAVMPTRGAAAAGAAPWFGVLDTQGQSIAQEQGAHISVASLELNWGAYEPSPGVIDHNYVAQEQALLSSLKAAGLNVTLDTGLQYPPSWVFGLDGNTRFVDQYGDVWHGSTSEDVPNTVFDPAVRSAVASYLSQVRADFGDSFYAIRAGGLLQNELRYPPASYSGHSNLFWAFDANAQAGSPVRGWIPGQADQAKAGAFLDYYLRSIAGYETWLLSQYRSHFSGWLQLLLPSWGLRPGDVATAVASNLNGSTGPASWGTLSMGLDWQREIDALPDSHAQLYSSWMERGDDGQTPNTMAPAHYLATLGAARGLDTVGENAGTDANPAAMVANARAWGLAGMMWLTEDSLMRGVTPGGLPALASAIASGGYSLVSRDAGPAAPTYTPPKWDGHLAGYRMTTSGGRVFGFGSMPTVGDLAGTHLNQPIVGMASTPSGQGYWLVASDGGIFPFGDAAGYGSTGGMHLNQPIVGMATTPGGHGYWLVASDGGIFPFGDAGGYGSTGAIHLNQPIVGMAATSDGHGYWLVASDGGIFPFGDAAGYGSTGNMRLNQPIVAMASTGDGHGYWLVASDGGIFPFGSAGGYGSTGNLRLAQPITGMTATASGHGYWLAARDGGVFPFGDATGYGSAAGVAGNGVVGMTTA